MTSGRTTRRQVLAAGLIAGAGITAIGRAAAAQEATPPATPGTGQTAADIGVVDAASRTLWDDTDSTRLVYQFTVLVFDTPEQATDSFRLITDRASGFAEAADATPEAVASTLGTIDRTDVEIGDEAVMYYQPDETGSAGIAILFVLDDTAVHQWSILPVPLQENALLVDPATLPEALLAVAEPWFEADPAEGEVLDLLPGLEQVPEGYTVLQESEGIDDLDPTTVEGTPEPGSGGA
ncbi:MAG TPA: hypothetical protein VGT61_06335 [Thermomicrobiales bacterium]|jgi:hypothetical protein|nr:hypothetical protein [Thermomicrobiales bacterium]